MRIESLVFRLLRSLMPVLLRKGFGARPPAGARAGERAQTDLARQSEKRARQAQRITRRLR